MASNQNRRPTGCCWSTLILKLQRLWDIQIQIQFSLCCAHAYRSFENYYEKLYGPQSRWVKLIAPRKQTSTNTRQLSHPDIKGTAARETLGETPYHHVRNHRDVFTNAPEAHRWDWRGVPRMWWPLRVYHRLSLVCFVFVLIKTTLGERLFALAATITGLPGHCVVLGRLIFHPAANGLLAFGLSGIHLIWRFYQYRISYAYPLNGFVFILQTERDLERFDALMRTKCPDHCNNLYEPLLEVESYQQTGHDQALPTGRRHTSGALGSSILTRRKRSALGGQQVAGDLRPAHQCRSLHEHFFRRLMYFKVEVGEQVYYRLRPNRTRRARAKLSDKMARNTIDCVMLTLVASVPIVLALATVLLSDLRHVQTYPGCSEQLDRRYAAGEISSLATFSFDSHLLLALPFELFENLFLWLDSGLSLTFVLRLVYLVNEDLMLAWDQLEHKIQLNLRLLESQTSNLHLHLQSAREVAIGSERNFTLPQLNIGRHPRDPRHWSLEFNSLECSAQWLAIEFSTLEKELNLLQYELFDFFQQVEQADLLVSDIISSTIIIWLSLCAMFSYCYLARIGSQIPIIIMLTIIVALWLNTRCVYHALRLRNRCIRSYPLICSIIAHATSISIKNKFLKVLEFFIDRQLMGYTLFHRYPFRGTIYITVIGWSLSCVALFYAMFGRDSRGVMDAKLMMAGVPIPRIGSRSYTPLGL